MTFRRPHFRIALVANVVLLCLGIGSIWVAATSQYSEAPLGDKRATGLTMQSGLGQAGPAPLQVPGTALPIPAPVPAPAIAPVVPAPQPLQAGAPGADPTQKLKADIAATIATSSAQTPGVVVEVENLGRVFEVNPDQMLTPASAQKLFTAGVALLKLGPNYQFRTEVWGSGGLSAEGLLAGDLVLVGGGDPSLGKADLAALAASLHASGVRAVAGAAWGDESRYDGVRSGPGWKPDYVTHESGTLSALAVDGNDDRKDPGYIVDPVSANVDLFREALKGAGITVNGATRVGRPAGDLRLLGTHYSPPLAALVGRMVRESDNFFAEMVLKEIGRTIGKPSTQGGAEAVSATVRSLGVNPGEIYDGSGLSPLNKQTAQDWLGWLRAIEPLTVGPTLRSSLAVSCVAPGTLKRRFCGTASAGQVFGKTGALPGSAVLVGYTTTASGRAVRFSFVLANNGSNRQARDAIDRAVITLREFQG